MSPTKKEKTELGDQNIKIDTNSNSPEINWADFVMADDSDSTEINLGDFDLDNDELVAKASQKIQHENALAVLVYVKNALSELGYETDNHNPFFFTSLVDVSDKELSGFLYVNRDGLYSNYQEKSELHLICSWDSVEDIELVEEGESSMRININSKEGKLTIHEPYSKNMLVLLSIYKNCWKKVLNEEINMIAFNSQEEYLNWLHEKNA
ncbi:MAG: hypothetical protein RL408_1088 [Bacteroidota bacterium]|jgi:hypothetical protein